MKTVKVIFKDSTYNYVTNINGQVSESEARKYFVGKYFDLGVYPKEDMQQCINIELI